MSKRIESGIVVAIGALTILTTTTVIHDQNAGKSDAVSRFVDGKLKQVEAWVEQRAVPAVAKTIAPSSDVSSPKQTDTGNSGNPPGSSVQRQGGVPSNSANQGSSKAGLGGSVIPAIPTHVNSTTPPGGISPAPKTTTVISQDKSQVAANRLAAQLQQQGWTAADVQSLAGIVTRLVTTMTPSDWTAFEQALASPETTAQSEQQILALLNTHLSPSDKQWLLMHFQGNMAFSSEDVQLLKEAVMELKSDMTPGEQQLLQQQASQLLAGVSTTN